MNAIFNFVNVMNQANSKCPYLMSAAAKITATGLDSSYVIRKGGLMASSCLVCGCVFLCAS
jgi:hypothetical protein